MTKAQIIAELPNLTPEDLAEVRAKLDELTGHPWLDSAELSDADKAALDAELAEYRRDPDAGSTWEEVEARLHNRPRP